MPAWDICPKAVKTDIRPIIYFPIGLTLESTFALLRIEA